MERHSSVHRRRRRSGRGPGWKGSVHYRPRRGATPSRPLRTTQLTAAHLSLQRGRFRLRGRRPDRGLRRRQRRSLRQGRSFRAPTSTPKSSTPERPDGNGSHSDDAELRGDWFPVVQADYSLDGESVCQDARPRALHLREGRRLRNHGSKSTTSPDNERWDNGAVYSVQGEEATEEARMRSDRATPVAWSSPSAAATAGTRWARTPPAPSQAPTPPARPCSSSTSPDVIDQFGAAINPEPNPTTRSDLGASRNRARPRDVQSPGGHDPTRRESSDEPYADCVRRLGGRDGDRFGDGLRIAHHVGRAGRPGDAGRAGHARRIARAACHRGASRSRLAGPRRRSWASRRVPDTHQHRAEDHLDQPHCRQRHRRLRRSARRSPARAS